MTAEAGAAVTKPVIKADPQLELPEYVPRPVYAQLELSSGYLLCDRTDESGNQSFSFYDRDYKPRTAAVYRHNLTAILADERTLHETVSLDFAISNLLKLFMTCCYSIAAARSN